MPRRTREFFYKVDSGPASSRKFNTLFTILQNEFSFVKINDCVDEFIPTRMKVVYLSRKKAKYTKGFVDYIETGAYLVQDNFLLHYIGENSEENWINFRSVPCGNQRPLMQNPALRRTVVSGLESQYVKDLSLSIYIENEKGTPRFIRSNLQDWKAEVYKSGNSLIYHHNAERSTKVKLYMNATDQNSRKSDLVLFPEDGSTNIPIESYMYFSVPVPATSGQAKIMPFPKPSIENSAVALNDSFVHELTSVGRDSYALVRSLILKRHQQWVDKSTAEKIICPVVNLCQSSGSGKSKLAFEMTNQGPGFFVVLRDTNEVDCYPPSNNVSAALLGIMADETMAAESFETLSDTKINASKSGMCLNWLGRIVFSYFDALFNAAAKKTNDGKSLEGIYRDIRPKLEQDFKLLDDESLMEYYNIYIGTPVASFKDLEVQHVSKAICNLLNQPSRLLQKMDLCMNEEMKTFAKGVKRNLTQFPFTFVLDEATLLNDQRFYTTVAIPGDNSVQKTTGVHIFRRACSYLQLQTKLIIVTLGTKSDVVDLHGPSFNSERNMKGATLLPPVILSGNQDIFDEYSKVAFDPSYESLKSPISFKELASYGHALWSSQLFHGMVDFAVRKLKNGSSAEKYKTIPSIWMIRAGVKADRANLFARELVASKMATLIDVDPELDEFAVAYPSEPILAMAARRLCKTHEAFPTFKESELIFTGLYDKLNTVVIDRGEYAENFGIMSILRAIDLSPNCAEAFESEEDYERGLDQMNAECAELKELWEKKEYLLEKDSSKMPYYKYPDYHVTTVGHFLSTLFKDHISDDELAKLPQITLDGIINASHFVKLTRNTGIDPKQLAKSQMPLANSLVSDKFRDVIDRSLLRLGLRRQCGFLLPDRYYGIDAILPVCLKAREQSEGKKRPVYTFIVIQIKTSQSVSAREIDSMYARLHFVSCPQKNSSEHDPKTCVHCEEDQSMELIFANQVAITLNVTGKPKKPKRNSFINYSSDTLTPAKLVAAIYGGAETDYSKVVIGAQPAKGVIPDSEEIDQDEEKEDEDDDSDYENQTLDVAVSEKKKAVPKFVSQRKKNVSICDFAHEYRHSPNLELNLRVWQYNSKDYLPSSALSKLPSSSKKRALVQDTAAAESASKKAKTISSLESGGVSEEQEKATSSVQGIVNISVQDEKTAETAAEKTAVVEKKVVHRMFALEWTGLDLIEDLFVHGINARRSALKILRRIHHLNEYNEDVEIKRYFKAVVNDEKVNSSNFNYITQGWRGHEPVTKEETVKNLAKAYKEYLESLEPVI